MFLLPLQINFNICVTVNGSSYVYVVSRNWIFLIVSKYIMKRCAQKTPTNEVWTVGGINELVSARYNRQTAVQATVTNSLNFFGTLTFVCDDSQLVQTNRKSITCKSWENTQRIVLGKKTSEFKNLFEHKTFLFLQFFVLFWKADFLTVHTYTKH